MKQSYQKDERFNNYFRHLTVLAIEACFVLVHLFVRDVMRIYLRFEVDEDFSLSLCNISSKKDNTEYRIQKNRSENKVRVLIYDMHILDFQHDKSTGVD